MMPRFYQYIKKIQHTVNNKKTLTKAKMDRKKSNFSARKVWVL